MSRLAPQISPPDDRPGQDMAATAADDGGARVYLYPQDAIGTSRGVPPSRRSTAVRNIVRPIAYVVIGVAVGLVYGMAIFGF